MMKQELIYKSGKFWDAPETDLFELPVVAYALGIGRNRMCNIPVKRQKIDMRWHYRKSDILDWAETNDGIKLLNELREKKKDDLEKIYMQLKTVATYY